MARDPSTRVGQGHAAFDRGFITVADSGQVLISERLGDSDRRALGLDVALQVSSLDESHCAYLRFHRERVFQGQHR
jgi:hypothetical protein